MYKKRMMLQLFDDGAGAGSGGQGGNAGTENGGQGSAGGASGAHGTGTYTYEQLEEIASSRAEKSERAALANFFRSQGMTEDEVTQAIAKFKTDRAECGTASAAVGRFTKRSPADEEREVLIRKRCQGR